MEFINITSNERIGKCLFRDMLEGQLHFPLYGVSIKGGGQSRTSNANGFLRSWHRTIQLELLETTDNPLGAIGLHCKPLANGWARYAPEIKVGELQTVQFHGYEICGQAFNGYEFSAKSLDLNVSTNTLGHLHATCSPEQISFTKDDGPSIATLTDPLTEMYRLFDMIFDQGR